MFLTNEEQKSERKEYWVDLRVTALENGYMVTASGAEAKKTRHVFLNRERVQSHVAVIVDGFCDIRGKD